MLVGRDVGQFRPLLERREHRLRPTPQFFFFWALQDILILRSRRVSIELDVLYGLQMQRHVTHIGDCSANARHDFRRRSLPAIRSSDVDVESTAIDGRILVAYPHKTGYRKHVGVARDDGGDTLLQS